MNQLLLQQVPRNPSGFVGTLESFHITYCLKDVRYQLGKKKIIITRWENGKDRGNTSKHKQNWPKGMKRFSTSLVTKEV